MSECLICSCNACYKSRYIHKSFVDVSGNANSFLWVSSLCCVLGFFLPFFPFSLPFSSSLPFLSFIYLFFFLFFLPYLLLITISLATHKRQFCTSLVSERGTSRWCVGREQGATEEKRMENPNVFCPGDGNSALKSPWGGEDGTSAPLMLSIRKLSAARCRNAG